MKKIYTYFLLITLLVMNIPMLHHADECLEMGDCDTLIKGQHHAHASANQHSKNSNKHTSKSEHKHNHHHHDHEEHSSNEHHGEEEQANCDCCSEGHHHHSSTYVSNNKNNHHFTISQNIKYGWYSESYISLLDNPPSKPPKA